MVFELYETKADSIEEYVLRGTRFECATSQLTKGKFEGASRIVLGDVISFGARSVGQTVLEEGLMPSGYFALMIALTQHESYLSGRVFSRYQLSAILGDTMFRHIAHAGTTYLMLVFNAHKLDRYCSEVEKEALLKVVNELELPRSVNEEVLGELVETLSFYLAEIGADRITSYHKPQVEKFHRLVIQRILNLSTASRPKDRSNGRAKLIDQAIDYVNSHAVDELSVPGLIAYLSVSRRSIEYAFKRYVGISPKEFIVASRLNRIRETLLSGVGSNSISDIARKFGVSHVGRFGGEYKEMFGELPSETMCKFE